MNVSMELMKEYEVFINAIGSFEGLKNHKKELDELQGMKQAFVDFADNAVGNSEKTTEPSGVMLNLLVPEDAETAKPYLEKTKELIQKIKEDKELMEKEPFLKAYLNKYEMKVNKALSDHPDAYDYLADNSTAVDVFLTQNMDRLPSSEEISKMSEADQKKMNAILKFMKAYNGYHELTEKIHEGTYQDPRDLSDDNYHMLLDRKLEKLQNASAELAEISQDEMGDFLLSNKLVKDIGHSFNQFYNDKKHDMHAAAKQTYEKRKQLGAFMTPEECSILQGYSSQVKSILGDAFGGNVEPKDLPENIRKITNTIVDMKEKCDEKLKNGFQSTAEKVEFFKKLGRTSQKFYDDYMTEDMPDNSTDKEIQAFESISKEFARNSLMKHGALKRSIDIGKRFESVEKAKNPEFINQLKNYYDMMKDTKNGYLFHTNSKEYERMMNTLKNMVALSKKDPLNDLERNVLTESYANISKDCRAYLTDKKLGSKTSEAGEDRFAGALGILNLVDPTEAEKVRSRAQEKRGKSVTFDGLKKRADEKKQVRDRKAQEAKAKEKGNEKGKEKQAL